MLYQAIRLGCQKYHRYEYSYDQAYSQYLLCRDAAKWARPETLDFEEVSRLITFANKWKCRMPSDPTNVKNILAGLRRVVPTLNHLLKDQTLLDVRLDSEIDGMPISQLIARCFDTIATAGWRNESVGTSKMIHAAINPSPVCSLCGTLRSKMHMALTTTVSTVTHASRYLQKECK